MSPGVQHSEVQINEKCRIGIGSCFITFTFTNGKAKKEEKKAAVNKD